MNLLLNSFVCFLLLLNSCSAHSQEKSLESENDDALELVIQSNPRINNVIDSSQLYEMKFVFFRSYVFLFTKATFEKKSINTKTNEISNYEYSEGVNILANHKDSNSVYIVENGIDSSFKKKINETPTINRTIMVYFFSEGFKNEELIKQVSGDTIYLTETITSALAGNKRLKYITAIEKSTNNAEIQPPLFSKLEELYAGRVVQCTVVNLANEAETLVYNFRYKAVDDTQKSRLIRIIDQIENINQSGRF